MATRRTAKAAGVGKAAAGALEQRNAELAVIDSIQQGIARSLDFQAIVDLVGDRLREVLSTGDLGIRWQDPDTRLVHYLYECEHGKRLPASPPRPLKPGGIGERLAQDRLPIVYATQAEMKAAGLTTFEGSDPSKCAAFVPIIGSNRVLGSIRIENHDRENAFGEPEVRLLQTVGASMGVALE